MGVPAINQTKDLGPYVNNLREWCAECQDRKLLTRHETVKALLAALGQQIAAIPDSAGRNNYLECAKAGLEGSVNEVLASMRAS